MAACSNPSQSRITSALCSPASGAGRDGGGALVDSGNGNVDFGGLLLSGQYLLTVTSSGLFSCGLPVRITARVRMGTGRVVGVRRDQGWLA